MAQVNPERMNNTRDDKPDIIVSESNRNVLFRFGLIIAFVAYLPAAYLFLNPARDAAASVSGLYVSGFNSVVCTGGTCKLHTCTDDQRKDNTAGKVCNATSKTNKDDLDPLNERTQHTRFAAELYDDFLCVNPIDHLGPEYSLFQENYTEGKSHYIRTRGCSSLTHHCTEDHVFFKDVAAKDDNGMRVIPCIVLNKYVKHAASDVTDNAAIDKVQMDNLFPQVFTSATPSLEFAKCALKPNKGTCAGSAKCKFQTKCKWDGTVCKNPDNSPATTGACNDKTVDTCENTTAPTAKCNNPDGSTPDTSTACADTSLNSADKCDVVDYVDKNCGAVPDAIKSEATCVATLDEESNACVWTATALSVTTACSTSTEDGTGTGECGAAVSKADSDPTNTVDRASGDCAWHPMTTHPGTGFKLHTDPPMTEKIIEPKHKSMFGRTDFAAAQFTLWWPITFVWCYLNVVGAVYVVGATYKTFQTDKGYRQPEGKRPLGTWGENAIGILLFVLLFLVFPMWLSGATLSGAGDTHGYDFGDFMGYDKHNISKGFGTSIIILVLVLWAAHVSFYTNVPAHSERVQTRYGRWLTYVVPFLHSSINLAWGFVGAATYGTQVFHIGEYNKLDHVEHASARWFLAFFVPLLFFIFFIFQALLGLLNFYNYFGGPDLSGVPCIGMFVTGGGRYKPSRGGPGIGPVARRVLGGQGKGAVVVSTLHERASMLKNDLAV